MKKERSTTVRKLSVRSFQRTARPLGFSHPPFQCPDMSPSSTNPSSVELVKAADIRVIAAMDIVKLFNPNVLGPAPIWTMNGYPTTINDTGFNLAVTGHNTLNFSEQARHLIDTFKSYPGLNFAEDWKLATVLIGMNDICDHCKNETLFSVDNFIHFMTEALDMMMNEVPRMIVNVVQIMPMETLREVQMPNLGCMLQKSFCSCLTLPDAGSPELKELVELNFEFQRRLEQLLHSDRFFKEDFAVVLQPYLKKAQVPRLPDGKVDVSFFAIDCFHFTIKGHEELAKGLWNNMFQPEGEKFILETFSESIELICPSKEHPYIYTRPSATSNTTTTTTTTPTPTPTPRPTSRAASAGLLQPLLFLPLLAVAYLL
ncbi:hypothetical protein AAFF_G00415730 [Aldrovandia affinis]|uniref:Phospholipase B1, membrane-associated n=1 Tax=Aldrovandia affinis TaxID=143900 RepID=A0AAD7WKC2_9TELE|nr:hypothetical protein AAFF_G00415730 [Aldrovandia affinis]